MREVREGGREREGRQNGVGQRDRVGGRDAERRLRVEQREEGGRLRRMKEELIKRQRERWGYRVE